MSHFQHVLDLTQKGAEIKSPAYLSTHTNLIYQTAGVCCAPPFPESLENKCKVSITNRKPNTPSQTVSLFNFPSLPPTCQCTMSVIAVSTPPPTPTSSCQLQYAADFQEPITVVLGWEVVYTWTGGQNIMVPTQRDRQLFTLICIPTANLESSVNLPSTSMYSQERFTQGGGVKLLT